MWWLHNPNTNSGNVILFVNDNRDCNSYYASNVGGVTPAFRIGSF